jgi:hypothetical protein
MPNLIASFAAGCVESPRKAIEEVRTMRVVLFSVPSVHLRALV